MPRLYLVPEGQLSPGGHGYDPDSLTWHQATPIIAYGETIGHAALSRAEVDGQTWIVADFDGEVESGGLELDIEPALERYEVTEGRPAHWVQSAVVRQLTVAEPGVAAEFDPPNDHQAEAAAILAQLQNEDEEIDVDEMAEGIPVEGVIVVEGVLTGDNRMIEPGAFTWDALPMPLIWDREDGDHTAMTVGRIEAIERRDNGEIWATGHLSASQDEATQSAVLRVTELLTEGAVGVSIAWDTESAEIRVSAEALERVEDDEMETDDEGNVIMARWEAGEEMYVVTSARIRHVAIVDTPAFAEAKIALVASGGVISGGYLQRGNESITADAFSGGSVTITSNDSPGWWSGYVVTSEGLQAHAAAASMDFDPPPRAWFEMAEPDETDPRVVWVNDEGVPCDPSETSARPWGVPLTVTAEGQVFGHLASWQDCHTGFEDRCVTPPQSQSGYAWFHTAATETDDGQVPTGRITVDTSHASHRMNAAGAVAHYDQTGHAVADVHITDGEFGPWMAGWVRPWATAQQRHELIANPPSGDWRPRGGSTELIGVLAVNVPGFPMPRSVATYQAGELASLVASGLPPVDERPLIEATATELFDRLARLEARAEADDILRELESV